jgi:hypothetical protein
VREDVDDDILAEQHFLRAHTEERRESETGLIVLRANSNYCSYWGCERSADNWALETLLKRASEPNKKITVVSLLLLMHRLLM